MEKNKGQRSNDDYRRSSEVTAGVVDCQATPHCQKRETHNNIRAPAMPCNDEGLVGDNKK
jgi:hypothetical protein